MAKVNACEWDVLEPRGRFSGVGIWKVDGAETSTVMDICTFISELAMGDI